jgi:hypothetical protein
MPAPRSGGNRTEPDPFSVGRRLEEARFVGAPLIGRSMAC